MLKIDNITIAYKDVPTVVDFSLDMAPGQIVSLVGESGSGKTTVIRAVLGLLAGGGKVTKGDILFNGTSLLSNTPEQWRNLRGSEISMIFQDSGAMMNPTRKIGSVFTEYLQTHEKISKKDAIYLYTYRCIQSRSMEERLFHASENASSGRRKYHEKLSTPAFRWYAPASRNCHGYDLSAEASAGR